MLCAVEIYCTDCLENYTTRYYPFEISGRPEFQKEFGIEYDEESNEYRAWRICPTCWRAAQQ
jgi:hypothetical protein